MVSWLYFIELDQKFQTPILAFKKYRYGFRAKGICIMMLLHV